MEFEGWIGTIDAMNAILSTVGADKQDGCILLYVEPPSCLGDEIVVPAGTEYSVNGVRRPLAALLRGTSQGLAITVI